MKYLIIAGVFALLLVILLIFSITSYNRMLKTYKKYDKEFVYCNLNGLQFTDYAIRLLKLDTKIYLLEKELDECYLPKQDIVCISNHTAETSSVSSICVSAHELGHAVQNKNQTWLFEVQNALSLLSKIGLFFFPFLLVIGLVLLFIPSKFELGYVLLIVAFSIILLAFVLKIITIPMEMQASKIAYNFLKDNNILIGDELKHAKKVLNAAIGTYIASLFVPIIKFFKGIGKMFRR